MSRKGNPKNKPIKNWAEEDRPREKLLLKGASSLSNAELLAIALGSGNIEQSALELAKNILDCSGNRLSHLSSLSIQELVKRHKGIGMVKAVNIISALELGNRRALEPIHQDKRILSSKHAFQELYSRMHHLTYETFWVLLLNRSKKLLRTECISMGGFTETSVDLRKIFKLALEWNTVEMIIAHNHPSGHLDPSQNDLLITKQIFEAGSLLNIQLIDHLILSSGNMYFSFSDEHLSPFLQS